MFNVEITIRWEDEDGNLTHLVDAEFTRSGLKALEERLFQLTEQARDKFNELEEKQDIQFIKRLNEDDEDKLVFVKPGGHPYTLSDNQQKFMADAQAQGFEITAYSGRGMFGQTCPAVMQERSGRLLVTHAKTSIDSMGKGSVVYAEY